MLILATISVEPLGKSSQRVDILPPTVVKSVTEGALGTPATMLSFAEIIRYKTLMTTFHIGKSPSGRPLSMQIYVIFAMSNIIWLVRDNFLNIHLC